MVDAHLINIAELGMLDVVTLDRGETKWVKYEPSIDLNDYEKVHSGGSSDSYILRSISDPNTYMGIKREDFFQSLLNKRSDELLYSARALVARMKEDLPTDPEGSVGGVPAGVDVTKPPKNFRDAMSREDRQEWAEAYDSEYQGFYDHGTLKVVRPEPGAKVIGTTTRTEYKVVNCVFKKRKVRLCVMGNQQDNGVHFQLGELYTPVMKVVEVRLFVALAAKHRLNLFKSDTKQAFLNGDMGNEKIYIRPPDWWQEKVPYGHALQLMKSMYGTWQAARQWHVRVLAWMRHRVNGVSTFSCSVL